MKAGLIFKQLKPLPDIFMKEQENFLKTIFCFIFKLKILFNSKRMKLFKLALLFTCLSASVNAQVSKAPVKKTTAAPVAKTAGTRVKVTTDMGIIIIRLYDATPQHRDNFIKLVSSHFTTACCFTVL